MLNLNHAYIQDLFTTQILELTKRYLKEVDSNASTRN